MACFPAGVFNRSSLAAGALADVFTADQKWMAEGIGDGPAKVLIVIGIVAQLMIEMRDARNRQFAGPMQVVQQMHERHGIAAARQGDDHARRRRREVVTADRHDGQCLTA